MTTVTCPYCPEDDRGDATIDDGLKCPKCGAEGTGERAADDYVNNIMGESKYSCIKDGGEWPIDSCNECGQEAFVDFGPQGDIEGLHALCFQCGHEIPLKSYEDYDEDPEQGRAGGATYCTICGRLFNSVGGEMVCDECMEARLAKDD